MASKVLYGQLAMATGPIAEPAVHHNAEGWPLLLKPSLSPLPCFRNGTVMPILNRRSLIVSGLATTLAGCANRGFVAAAPANTIASYGLDALKLLDLSIENLTRITVCIRPLRPAGPRLETERRNGKTILHNYGHGGSGWSLAWGYAEAARDLLSKDRPRSVAVLGAGAIGLTTAIAIAETGAKVTIFARDLPMESRSARATGV
ncbi:MAG: FAD-dependent oxidoreductase, partial [Pseudomonadota bacterium]